MYSSYSYAASHSDKQIQALLGVCVPLSAFGSSCVAQNFGPLGRID